MNDNTPLVIFLIFLVIAILIAGASVGYLVAPKEQTPYDYYHYDIRLIEAEKRITNLEATILRLIKFEEDKAHER